MKRFAAICTMIAFCVGQTFLFADNDKDNSKDKEKQAPGLAKKNVAPPGLEKKDGDPPGLEKKDGLPPGIAKKQEQPANTTGTPATASVPSAPSAPITRTVTATPPAKPAQPAPAPIVAKPAPVDDQKARLDGYIRTINQGAQGPRLRLLALRQIANETGVPFERLEQQEKSYPGIGAASLLLGNLVAKRSRAPFESVIEGRSKDRSWAEIAKRHNVDLGPLIQKAQDVAMVLQAANTAAAR